MTDGTTIRNGADVEAMVDDEQRLLAFLTERDEPCPSCGYNLRDLPRPVCPECRQDLYLTVGAKTPETLWIVLTIAPSVFSGICSVLITGGFILFGGPGPGVPWFFMAVYTFGWLSGLAGFILLTKRRSFARLDSKVQATWALGTWTLHVGIFMALVWFTAI